MSPERVAIVGLAVRFPESGASLTTFWENVIQARDCAKEVPQGRWTIPPGRAVHSQMPRADAVPTSRGYYLDPFEPDLEGLDIPHELVAELDPLFHLVLDVGNRAVRTAKLSEIDRKRAGVILGNICLPTEKANDLARKYLCASNPTHPLNRYPTGLPAGLLAQALGFGGLAFTLDAACASTLYAIKLAADELTSGRADLMLAGGASRPDCLYTQMGFAQLRALSPRGVCAPFSHDADGLVVGEGAGLFVLKRVSDAVRAGDHIYATLAGAGLSNDLNGNLLAPAMEGQLRAMRTAYATANWKPSEVGLIECHATGTPVGDAVEFNSLRELWKEESFSAGRCVIGSVKSTVGHLLTAAGAAAVAKVLLAFEHGVKPPQANFKAPHAGFEYDNSPFRVLLEAESWTELRSRRAAVSGFGFGGVNAHLLFEEWDQTPCDLPSRPAKHDSPIAIIGMAAHVGPWGNLREFQEYALGGGNTHAPKPRMSGWEAQPQQCPPGQFIESLAVPLDRFRIPPKEIEAMLPQQLLILQTAAKALDDCQGGSSPEVEVRTGVYIGLGLDLNATNYHLRWAGDETLPALTADRVMGALGSIAASRIARTFAFGGPSFTVCSEGTSAGRAIELAVRALRNRDLDRVVAGGVELVGDPRALLAADEVKSFTRDGPPPDRSTVSAMPADGAAVLVLKRLEDAERDGDRIYAVISGVGSAVGSAAGVYASSLMRACQDGGVDPVKLSYYDAAVSGSPSVDRMESEALAALLKASPRTKPLVISGTCDLFGQTGFAGAAVSLVRTALALYQQILPPSVEHGDLREILKQADLECSATPRYWLANHEETPRRAALATSSVDGTVFHCILEEYRGASISHVSNIERSQPLGARQEALFVVEGDSTESLLVGMDRLTRFLPAEPCPIEALAREWNVRTPVSPVRRLAVTFVTRSTVELKEQIEAARESLRSNSQLPDSSRPDPRSSLRDRVFYSPEPIGQDSRIAFVFPGSGNHYAGMGRELAVQWPHVLRRQQQENESLRKQWAPWLFWADEIPPGATPRDFLFGQVVFGTLTADLLQSLGIAPDAMIGQSLGESAGLFGMRIWHARDEMFRRLQESTLFTTDLGPPFNSARAFYKWPSSQPFEWITGIIASDADEVRARLRPEWKAHLLIITGPGECVIGGERDDVKKLVSAVQKPFLQLHGVTLAHCDAGQTVRNAYHHLHQLPVNSTRISIYSGVWAKPYQPSEQNCADSITAGLLKTIDVPQLIEAAYRDGIRAFIEVGPGGSTTRMIDAILGDRPHVARTVAAPRQDDVSQVLRVFARLITERFPVTLEELYGDDSACAVHREPLAKGNMLELPTGFSGSARGGAGPVNGVQVTTVMESEKRFSMATQSHSSQARSNKVTPQPAVPDITPFIVTLAETTNAVAEAHARFLAIQDGFFQSAMTTIQLQSHLILRMQHGTSLPRIAPPRFLTFEQCQTFATGKASDVLGPLFAEVDTFPTRVRLPEGPLMLVDRVLTIEGEPKSMKHGRVVTEHTVHKERWYLDAGRCPTSIAVESGQADLFLSGFLGIDFQTCGLAVYRLLDAVVTFHRELPRIGETITYDIHIDEFFRQADSWLFRFRFEGTIAGQPMLSMANGVAGFFTDAALAAGQGVVHTKLDLLPQPGKSFGFTPLIPVGNTSLDEQAVNALRRGDYVSAFGSEYAAVGKLHKPMDLPGGMLRLVDRVPSIIPDGGRFGLGFIRAEYDIRPREWFIECHFVDDKVMPGTLMYECCLHTLRILLHRFGWIGEEGTVCEPVPGVASRLKCRGQVLETTKTVTYEINVKEIGYRPEPYAIADALMYADGKPIVEITNMSLRMNLKREDVHSLWQQIPERARPGLTATRTYDSDRILAYSNGKPSEAFGEPYQVFDTGRVIARLPGPPYQFLDRIINVQGDPFVMASGASCIAEYEVPRDAWYFLANRSPLMPFSVLLEIALQPCGWLAAYCGSALTSPVDLKFRNLGGKSIQYRAVMSDIGKLTANVTMMKVSSSAGMIIQHYDMKVSCGDGIVYDGETYFGFFTADALQNQIGMPTAKVPFLSDEQKMLAEPDTLPRYSPFPDSMLRMVDCIDGWLPHGGRAGLGLVQGRIAVDPDFWFFKAHFYQDPVWPGSLGLESFLQLLKYAAWKKWNVPPQNGWQTVALNSQHSWTYRGQVLPTDHEVVVVLEVTNEDRALRKLTADGYLIVDGRIIYQMTDFTLE